MKKTQLAIMFVLICSASFAQFDSTKYVIGGLVNYGTSQNKTKNINDSQTNSTSSFFFSPSIAKPIKSNGVMGVELGFGAGSSKNKGGNFESMGTNQHYSLGVFYQRFYTITNKIYFNWNGRARVGLNKSVSEYTLSETFQSKTTEYTTSYDLTVTPGISWKVMDRVLLNGSIGGAAFQLNDREGGSDTSFSIFFNNPQFGFSFLLN
ncbi:hypothetical protein [uncultured Imperialibacter sp.]|uniref:hypothetical protein n=1 Tax=uncultured Imperialibacter sp. TaxID=1672639 RepID=UPI0030DAA4B9